LVARHFCVTFSLAILHFPALSVNQNHQSIWLRLQLPRVLEKTTTLSGVRTMRRNMKSPATHAQTNGRRPAAPPAPHVIIETAIYTVEAAMVALKLCPSTIRREVRQGRLRIAKRAGRYYLLGAWLLEWVRGGEVVRHGSAATVEAGSDP